MAASEDLTIRMRAKGAARAAKDVDKVAAAVHGVSSDSDIATTEVNIFARALTVLQTRAAIATVILGALGVAMIGVVPALALLIAAGVALGAVFLPVGLLIAGAVQRFGDTASIAGSAASDLADVLFLLKHAWNTAISPGASIVLRGASVALKQLIPLVQSMEGPLSNFARAMSSAMLIVAQSLGALGPEISGLINMSGAMLTQLAPALATLLGTFIDIAVGGMPVLSRLIGWIVTFIGWLRPAVNAMVAFFNSAALGDVVSTVFASLADAGTAVWGVIKNLSLVLYGLYTENKPLIAFLGGSLLLALHMVGGVLGFVANHMRGLMDIVRPLTSALIAGLVVWKAYLLVGKISALIVTLSRAYQLLRAGQYAAMLSQLGLNAAFLMNPVVLIAAGILAFAAALWVAYNKSEFLRSIVARMGRGFENLKGDLSGLSDTAVQAFQWIGDKADWLFNKLEPLLDVVKKTVQFSPLGVGAAVLGRAGVGGLEGISTPGLASGGTVREAGIATVGEKGRERVFLPAGAVVERNSAPAARGNENIVVQSYLMFEDEPAARAVQRASRRKRAVS